MDTIRTKILYRPLRIGWAIRSGDMNAFRKAVRLSYALWGGRFNPILVVDQEEEAKDLVDLFRVDLVWGIGDNDEVKAFSAAFPYLIKPFFHDTLFVGETSDSKYAQVLDLHNALLHSAKGPEWKVVKDRGVRIYNWELTDPLSDVFLMQLGQFPDPEETGIDYRAMLRAATGATEHTLGLHTVIPADVLEYPGISYMSRHGIERHHTVEAGREIPGFFVGDVSAVEDLVCYWNLRAADIPLLFVDPSHLDRYAEIIPAWEKELREWVTNEHKWERPIGVWSRHQDINEAAKPFGDMKLVRCGVSNALWNGRNVRPPTMHLGEVSTLGVVGLATGRPRVSFALTEKPFSSDFAFHQQHLVASISFVGGLYQDEQYTLEPPYVPELNEFYARTMHFEYDKVRSEPGRVGLVVDTADNDGFLNALPVAELMERLFDLAGYRAKLSNGGLIVRQLIARLGGLQGARVFKIPGVRRLLRTYGPTTVFTEDSALQLIGSKDPNNPGATFSDYEDLYIERRARGIKLRPREVFGYLVEKGLFRIGAELACPGCRMKSWTALDELRQRVVCELCGHEHVATRQLIGGKWHYRRSGVLGAEKNAQGAVPVALTLQQLETNLRGGLHDAIYCPSVELEAKAQVDLPKCEVDFVWVIPGQYPQKTAVILGECKDQGPVRLDEFEKDVHNLRRVADALPRQRFKTFVLLSKLGPFTRDEIERAKTLNDEFGRRTILLTSRELEPYFMYERTKTEFDINGHAGTPEDLAQATHIIYFQD